MYPITQVDEIHEPTKSTITLTDTKQVITIANQEQSFTDYTEIINLLTELEERI